MTKTKQELTKDFLLKHYKESQLSTVEISEKYGFSISMVRRALIKYKIPLRSKSTAQKIVLETGRADHPMEGKTHTLKSKEKIGASVTEAWDSFDEAKLQDISRKAQLQWNNRPEKEKEEFRQKAQVGLRKAVEEGSKLEKFICKLLEKNGYKVQFHMEHGLKNARLQVDIMLPADAIAIEIDGPSHFFPIWGDESFYRQQKADMQKSGLLRKSGFVLIRVKNLVERPNIAQRKQLSKNLLDTLKQVQSKRPTQDKAEIIVDYT
jgi:very-short-patch-repair endonuclease